MAIYENITELIGNTPIVKLNRLVPEGAADVYVKLEAFNPGSSVKDRIALSMIEKAEADGLIKPGDTIVEATSGNTGIGLSWVGAAKGYKVVIVMPETMSEMCIRDSIYAFHRYTWNSTLPFCTQVKQFPKRTMVKPQPLTSDLSNRLRSLYAQ